MRARLSVAAAIVRFLAVAVLVVVSSVHDRMAHCSFMTCPFHHFHHDAVPVVFRYSLVHDAQELDSLVHDAYFLQLVATNEHSGNFRSSARNGKEGVHAWGSLLDPKHQVSRLVRS